jgi:signal transduction histidine kinase
MKPVRLVFSRISDRACLKALAWLLLCVPLHALPANAEERFPDGVIAVFEMDYYPDYEGTKPPGANERSIKRKLPAGFSIKGEDTSYQGRWFRTEFEIDHTKGAPPLAVYIPNVIQNVAIYLDGELIGASDGVDRPTALNWNIPHVFALPESLLKPGRHYLHVRIYSGIRGTGRLSPFAIGSAQTLAPLYQQRAWLQLYGTQTICFVLALIGSMSIVLWLRRRDETAFGYFALVCILWIARNFHLVTRDPLLPAPVFYVMTHSSALWLSAAIYAFCFRMLGKRFFRLEMAFWAYAAISTLALSLADAASFWRIAGAMLIPPQFAAIALVIYLAWQAWQRREFAITLLFAATSLTVLLGVYDALLWQNKLPFPRIYLMPYASLLFAAVAGWALVDRFVRAQTKFEKLNRELEHRVREREADLAQNYAKLAELERERTIVLERQRILREIHDGLGSQLLTSISLVERGQMDASAVASLLRECVDDLRIAIDSLRPTGTDLIAVLGNLRYRLEPRLTAAGISLTWRIRDIQLPALDSASVLNIMRMVQEALTNTVKHAHATSVVFTFDFDETAGRHCLTISDNGRGFDAAGVSHGEGLRNMKVRAHNSGTSVQVTSSGQGTMVIMHLRAPDQLDSARGVTGV